MMKIFRVAMLADDANERRGSRDAKTPSELSADETPNSLLFMWRSGLEEPLASALAALMSTVVSRDRATAHRPRRSCSNGPASAAGYRPREPADAPAPASPRSDVLRT